MSSYSLTKARVFQYVGILFALALIAAGYWYFSVRAGVKSNTSASQPQGAGQLDSGLAGYWKLDETTGSSATDASTNGNTGTLTNMENGDWVAGQIGNGLDFDGTNEYVAASATRFAPHSSGTISAWIKSTNSSVGQTIFGVSTFASANYAGFFATNSDGKLWLRIKGNGVDLVNCSVSDSGASAQVAASGTWTFVTITNDTASGKKFYKNGVLQGSDCGADTTWFNALSAQPPVDASLGSWLVAGGTQQLFQGSFDEVRVYDRTLSSDEVGQLYRLTAPTSVDTSLKGYWSFNGDTVSGTTAYDRSGAGNTGTLTNGPIIDQGIAGQALSFDGTNDYVTAGNETSLQFTGNISLSTWIKPTSLSDYKFFLGKFSTGTDAGYDIGIMADGRLAATFRNGSHTDGFSGAELVTAGVWQYITVTQTVADCSVRIYKNGILATTLTNQQCYTNPAVNFYIGNRSTDASTSFPGLIDEPRVYNRVLSVSEIKGLYDIAKPDATNSSSSQAQGTGRLDSGLAGYWPLDNGSGTSATDLSTNSNTGTLTNGPTWTTGQIGSAVQFDGTNDTINLSSSTALDLDSAHTISAWVKTTVSNTDQNIFTSGTAGCCGVETALRLEFNEGSGTYRFRLNHTSVVNAESSEQVQTDTWYHVVGTWDGNSVKRIYVNGTLSGSTSLAALSGAEFSNNAAIGADGDGNTPWNGSIDEVRVYHWALADEDVAELYRLTAPTSVDTSLKGYWPFNGQDMTSTTAYDRSGAGKNATLSGSPTISRGIASQGMTFDGVNDYATTTATIPSQGSMSVWAKPNIPLSPSSRGYFQYASEGGGHFQFGFNTYDGFDTWEFTYRGGYGSTVTIIGSPYASDSVVQQWHHVVVSWDTATGSQMYVDGVLVSSTTGTTGSFTAMPLSIGAESADFWKGNIDEVRLYNRILSASEAKGLYDAAAPDKTNTSVTQPQGTGRLDSGLAGYWKLDDGSGTTAVDTSTNGNNGTLTNSPTWTMGQIGGAITFDHALEKYVSIPDSAVLSPSGKMSVSVWAKRTDNIILNDRLYVGKSESSERSWGVVSKNDGSVRFYVATAAGELSTWVQTSTTPITQNVWAHVVAVFDGAETGSTNRARIYVNGSLQPATATGSIPATLVDSAASLLIGYGGGLNYGTAFTGDLDEVRVYNRGLSADEVSQLYRLSTPTGTDTSLKGYWSFNGQDLSGTTASDRSGTGNNGTLTNGPTAARGKLGQALSFDGANDYVAGGTPSVTTYPLTLAVWFKTTSTPADYAQILMLGSGGTSLAVIAETITAECGGAGKIKYAIRDSVGVADNVCSTTTLNDGQWHHAAGVSSSASDHRLYVDGVLQNTGTTALGTVLLTTTTIGGNTGSQFFTGTVDEARIYNRALSASEVLGLYNQSR